MFPDSSKLVVLRSLPLLYRFIHHSIGGSHDVSNISKIIMPNTIHQPPVSLAPSCFRTWKCFEVGVPCMLIPNRFGSRGGSVGSLLGVVSSCRCACQFFNRQSVFGRFGWVRVGCFYKKHVMFLLVCTLEAEGITQQHLLVARLGFQLGWFEPNLYLTNIVGNHQFLISMAFGFGLGGEKHIRHPFLRGKKWWGSVVKKWMPSRSSAKKMEFSKSTFGGKSPNIWRRLCLASFGVK